MDKKVLITEVIDNIGIAMLEQDGIQVDVKLDLTKQELIEVIGDYDALILRSGTIVDREVIEAAKRLRVIGRAGTSVNNVDLEAATEQGITVCNAPYSNIISCAELTMGLLLACARNLPQANASMHAGLWNRNRFVGSILHGKTLAIIGLGRVGGLVAERALAFGMRVIAYDDFCNKERAAQLGVSLCDTIDDALSQADFITVHLPKTKRTIGLFGPEQIAKMKDGVVLIDTAQGGIYNIDSLADFMAAGKIAAVGIDAFETEPCYDSPLHSFKNAIITPHISAATHEAQFEAARLIAEYVKLGLAGSIVPTALNGAPLDAEAKTVVGPYLPVCQMMGSMIDQTQQGIPQDMKIIASQSIDEEDMPILASGVLKGLFSYKNIGSITPENAESIAVGHGIKLSYGMTSETRGYSSRVEVCTPKGQIACTLAGEGSIGRIVSFNNYLLDIAPASQSLIFEYVDAPGRMGVIGTILGESGINITTMQIGKKPEEECALVFLNVVGNVDDEVLARLREGIYDLKNMWHIRF